MVTRLRLVSRSMLPSSNMIIVHALRSEKFVSCRQQQNLVVLPRPSNEVRHIFVPFLYTLAIDIYTHSFNILCNIAEFQLTFLSVRKLKQPEQNQKSQTGS